MSVTFTDIFCGIGGFRIVCERSDAKCVFSVDDDTDACEVYTENFEKINCIDIESLDPATIPDHDLLTAGWPCPPFSIIGNREAFGADDGLLFYEIVEIIEEKEPRAFILENVKHLTKIENGRCLNIMMNELSNLGYSVEWDVLNALDFGLPQQRERVIIVGVDNPDPDFEIPQKDQPLQTAIDQREALEELLEEDPDERYYASEEIQLKREKAVDCNPPKPSIWHENRSKNVSVNPYACALRANPSWNYQLVNGVRHPTPRELLRLQGFPEWFEIPTNSYSTVRKLTGRTVPIPMIESVVEETIRTIQRH